jgi:hypothetical protein
MSRAIYESKSGECLMVMLGIPYPHPSLNTSTVPRPPILIRVKCVMYGHGDGDRGGATMCDARTCTRSQYSTSDACMNMHIRCFTTGVMHVRSYLATTVLVMHVRT